jgi:hypothetical protein
MRRILPTAAALLLLACVGKAEAAFVTYTEMANATGTIGTTSFTDALLTITGTADTNDVVRTGGAGILGTYSVLTATTFTIAGVASGTITDPVEAFDHFGAAGFMDVSPAQTGLLLITAASPFNTYDLKSSIGPIGGLENTSPILIGTTAGNLFIDSIPGFGSFFTAVVSGAAVPEPSSLTMMGLGVVFVAAWGRSKARRTQTVRA